MSVEAMKQATPHDTLIEKLMDPSVPKTEIEHAAAREIENLRQAIEQAEKQEPVAWMTNSEQDVTAEFLFCHVQTPMHNIPLYAAPPKREWVGLTQQEINSIVDSNMTITDHLLRDAIEAIVVDIEVALMEKNT